MQSSCSGAGCSWLGGPSRQKPPDSFRKHLPSARGQAGTMPATWSCLPGFLPSQRHFGVKTTQHKTHALGVAARELFIRAQNPISNSGGFTVRKETRLAAAVLSKFTVVASGLQGARVLSADCTAGRKSGLDVNLGVWWSFDRGEWRGVRKPSAEKGCLHGLAEVAGRLSAHGVQQTP